MFQNPEHQFLTGSVRAELALGHRGEGPAPAELMDLLGLAALGDANPFTLSGGEQRRLSVASALATDPALLVLDEPTFGQDLVTWTALVRLLAARRDAGAALLCVTHDEEFAAAVAHRRIRVQGGRLS